MRTIDKGPVTAKRRCGSTERPQRPISRVPKIPIPTSKQNSPRDSKRYSNSFDQSTGVGASQSMPITIDSDHDGEESNTDGDSDAQVSKPRPSMMQNPNRSGSVYSPLRKDRDVHDRPTNMRDARTSRLFSRIKPDTPGPYQYRSLSFESKISPPSCRAAPDDASHLPPYVYREEESNNGMDMTLAEISHFNLRAKVAKLMAVAPALPVRDLYHLIKRTPSLGTETSNQNERSTTHGDDIMVKLDPNDPAFEWDSDEPPPEPAPKSKSKYKKGNKPKSPTKRTKSETNRHPGTGLKRTKSAPANPTHARETSSDRDFIVADNVIHYVLSDSDEEEDIMPSNRNKDSDIEMLDMDDALDLDIDMRSKYRFNAGLLGKKRRKQR
ncbi:hypothetical protein BDW02DRAFT_629224 [Decorospora gaudefroyi]|uniref:Uncharacterized protein n=1 Tax=Decorospora gaudefroyi TaxID=184978 RepID=A0A6A5KK28_9PLEO|nr:hypothetical protein BDW02DRAFT_629224 [Decorospora gaudefroyi]